MPLVGTKCCQGGERLFSYCLDECRGERCLHPLHILKYMARNEALREGIEYSATSILGCARRQVLQKRVDFYEDPDANVARFVGDAVHEMSHALLLGEPGYVGETRIWATVGLRAGRDFEAVPGEAPRGRDFRLSGKADQRWFDSRVVDLKSTGKIPNAPRADHVAQINIYAWMMRYGEDEFGRPLNLNIDRGSVVYVSGNQKREVVYNVPIWDEDRQLAFIKDRLEAHVYTAETGEYPPVLTPQIVHHRDGSATVTRDWHCDWCPVRTDCDALATAERGVSPDHIDYWEQGPGIFARPVGEPSFEEGF